jgi:hypothetical protein
MLEKIKTTIHKLVGKKPPNNSVPHTEKAEDVAVEMLGFAGKMITYSKSVYIYDNPNNLVVFNANVAVNGAKVWHGDLDLTKDWRKIVDLGARLNARVDVYYESSYRFDNVPKDGDEVFTYDPIHGPSIGQNVSHLYEPNLDFKGDPMVKKENWIIREDKQVTNFQPTDGSSFSRSDFKRYSVNLPNLSKIKGTKKYGSPWVQLQSELIKMYGKDKTAKFYPDLWLSNSDYNKLSLAHHQWAQKYYKELHPVKAEQAASMDEFQFAPCALSKECSWAKTGSAYVRKK